MDKAATRTDIRARLAALRPAQRALEEDVVNAALIADADVHHADVLLVYRAVRSELSLVSVTNDALRRGVRVCFPKVRPGGLSLHQVTDWSQLVPGAHGIPEPIEACPVVSPATVDVALVPGIAWTRDGRRLGQGGGFYDRLLPMLGGISVGVGFDCQMVDVVPTEPHDRPVDRVVWPGQVMSAR